MLHRVTQKVLQAETEMYAELYLSLQRLILKFMYADAEFERGKYLSI
jgi:hypothetical protein